ncbi:hypothetical protein IV203_014974 [Nitzschia inconspicua]|uniref:Uncharacterized protein n=1 Tax=Nitzschia inconspicua TaxID=303405 RepID=A0A9K3LBV7_9STRA|nr:hypothetical protein IV203_014974 [Nitzschia inconspicua]
MKMFRKPFSCLAFSVVFLSSQYPTRAALPPNDRCVNSITLEAFEPVDGDNTNANFDFINQGVCGARSDRRALWYEIIGSGKPVTVYVCTNNEKITDFGVFLTCNTQRCVGAPDQLSEPANCDDGDGHSFTFDAELGEDYFVHVRSDTLDPEGSNFTIWYTEPTDSPTMVPDAAFSIYSMTTTFVLSVAVIFVGSWALL